MNDFNAELVICDKHRKRANEIASMQLIGEVKDKNVILVDDICDTAGTLVKAASLIKEKGAISVRAVCTHAILSGQAFARLRDSELTEIIMTDTLPMSGSLDKIKVLTCAELFAKAIQKIHEHQSISPLFM